MGEEFQAAGVCGGSWWNSSKTAFGSSYESSMLSSSTTTTADWNQSLFQDSSTNLMKGESFPINIQQDCTTCEEGSGSVRFPITSSTNSTYTYPSSNLIQSLFDDTSPPLQESVFDNGSMNFSSNGNNYLSDSLPYWNASSPAFNDVRPNFFPSAQPQFMASTYDDKLNRPNHTVKPSNGEIGDAGSVVKKSCNEQVFKRPRLETPSPLPTFKVRKEKLGDRITALQQLVSPFGKTDTASVLHEAIEYIKILHDQVNVLSTPYLKNNGAGMQRNQISDNAKDSGAAKQDLKSRGLCLVPVSSTFPVATETTADFWAPTFGTSFR